MHNAGFFLYPAGSASGLCTRSAGYAETKTCQPVCLTLGKSKEGGVEKTLNVTGKEGVPGPQLVQLPDHAPYSVWGPVPICYMTLSLSWLLPVLGPQAED